MAEELDTADKPISHPNPFFCPRVSAQRRKSVPFISFGFTTGLPRPALPCPAGGGKNLSAIASSNLRLINFPIDTAAFHQLLMGT